MLCLQPWWNLSFKLLHHKIDPNTCTAEALLEVSYPCCCLLQILRFQLLPLCNDLFERASEPTWERGRSRKERPLLVALRSAGYSSNPWKRIRWIFLFKVCSFCQTYLSHQAASANKSSPATKNNSIITPQKTRQLGPTSSTASTKQHWKTPT